MIEAMACGTPVIAFRSGSVPEVIDDGVTGFIVEDEEHAVRAVKRIGELDRRKVRERFEQRFSAPNGAGICAALRGLADGLESTFFAPIRRSGSHGIAGPLQGLAACYRRAGPELPDHHRTEKELDSWSRIGIEPLQRREHCG